MKKIFTLFAGLLMAAAVFAADHRPVVRLDNNRHFKVVIDGRSYFGDNLAIRLDNFYGSRIHTVRVYEMRRGMFFTRERLVDTKTFILGREDLMIRIGMFGQVNIREMRDRFPGRDRDDRGWNDRDGRDNNWDNGGYDRRDNGSYDQGNRDGRNRF